ncbi:odorant receptor 94a-like isoform X1 [Ooceraea biroi]|uniref:odorant receptor 94a-like isoform X1 n=1 Tax=Ooceraea biroi TaxID=2015173 RepID=UPI000F085FC8|nr:odorant receptor 94a-like isoform X1 [Ooceraea biroi]XP_026828389.1 odorant receptor 94a-like isoform X1 [Ooceraea biroi]
MRAMQFPLKILMVAGCWPPVSWSSLCKRTVYNGYTIFVTLMLVTFMFPQIMDIILNVDNADDFTETFYVMLATVIASCKMFSLLLNRKNIKILTDTLAEKPFRPLEPDEIEIRQKVEDTIRTNSIWYIFLVEITCACINLTSLLTKFRRGDLTYREWTPYEYSSVMYYITYFRQLISLSTAAIVNVACDCIICGLLVHICCEIDILKYRLRKSLRNRTDFRECVRQHDSIYKFAYTINENFRIILAIQFAVSTLVVCSNMYQIARTSLSAEYIPLMLYTSCMFTQILIYCWYGNEVKLKSVQLANEIFEMDWITVDKEVKEGLMMIMNRSLVPIEFSSAHIFTVNLDSFVKVGNKFTLTAVNYYINILQKCKNG